MRIMKKNLHFNKDNFFLKKINQLKKLIVISGLLFFSLSTVFSVEYTWTNATGDGNMENLANWVSDPPTTDFITGLDDVIIDADLTVIVNPGYPLEVTNATVTSGNTLTSALTIIVSNTFKNNGNIDYSDASITVGSASSAGAFINNGTLTNHESGAIEVYGTFTNTGIIENNGTIIVHGNLNNSGAIENNGTIYIYGDFTDTADYSGSGQIIIIGNGNQNISGSGSAVYNVLVQNTGASSEITFSNAEFSSYSDLSTCSCNIVFNGGFSYSPSLSNPLVFNTSGNVSFSSNSVIGGDVIHTTGKTIIGAGFSSLKIECADLDITAAGTDTIQFSLIECSDLNVNSTATINTTENIVCDELNITKAAKIESLMIDCDNCTISANAEITTSVIISNDLVITAAAIINGATSIKCADLTITATANILSDAIECNKLDVQTSITLSSNLTAKGDVSVVNNKVLSLTGSNVKFDNSSGINCAGTIDFNGTDQEVTFCKILNDNDLNLTCSASSTLEINTTDVLHVDKFNHTNGELTFNSDVEIYNFVRSSSAGEVIFDDVNFSNSFANASEESITFTKGVTFGVPVQINGNTVINSSENLEITNVIQGAYELTINASGKKVSLIDKTSDEDTAVFDIDIGSLVITCSDLDISADIKSTGGITFNTAKINAAGNTLFNSVAGDLTLNSASSLVIANTGTYIFDVNANLITTVPVNTEVEIKAEKNVSAFGNYSGLKYLIFDGSGNQNLISNDKNLEYENIRINKTSGDFTASLASGTTQEIADRITIQNLEVHSFSTVNLIFNQQTEIDNGNVLACKNITFVNHSDIGTMYVTQCNDLYSSDIGINSLEIDVCHDFTCTGNAEISDKIIINTCHNVSFAGETGGTTGKVEIERCSNVDFTGNVEIDSFHTVLCSNNITFGNNVTLNNFDVDSCKDITFGRDTSIINCDVDLCNDITVTGVATITTFDVDSGHYISFLSDSGITTFDVDSCHNLGFAGETIISSFDIDTCVNANFEKQTKITTFTDTENSKNFDFYENVIFENDVISNSTGSFSFVKNDRSDITVTFGTTADPKNFSHTGGNTSLIGSISAKNITVAQFELPIGCTVTADNLYVYGNITEDSRTTLDLSKDMKFNCNVIAGIASPESGISITNSGNFDVQNGKSFTYYGNLVQVNTSSGNFLFSGKASGSGKATFKNNVYLYGAVSADSDFGSATNVFDITENLIVNRNGTADTKIISDVSSKNIILFNGNVNLSAGKKITSLQDVVLLGSAYNTGDFVENVYEFTRYSNGIVEIKNNYVLGSNLPTGAAPPTSYSGKITAGNGAIIHCEKNFFANGLTLNGAAEWYIDIQKNSDASISFAEAYRCTASNCVVRMHSGTGTDGIENPDNAQIAADSCTLTACRNWDTDPFEIVKAETVRDNVIKMSFTRMPRNLHKEMFLNCGQIKFYAEDSTYKSFTGVYKDELCTTLFEDETLPETQTISGKSYYVLYLKTTNGSWATDATGLSAGTTGSTDRFGNVRNTAKPSIQIQRVGVNKAFIITDRFGKRLRHYCTQAGTTFTEYTDTLDKTAPSLIAVRTGQENHESVLADQKPYDAHNFVEFRYSEKVSFFDANGKITALDGTSPWNVNVKSSFGAIKENMTSAYQSGVSVEGITFAGLGKIQNGYIQTGIRGNISQPAGNNDSQDSSKYFVNTLYRPDSDNFSIRISIAGLRDNTKKWVGYIESGKVPSGTVDCTTEFDNVTNMNAHVQDVNGNQQCEYPANDNTGGNKTNIQVNADITANSVYGSWDLSEPQVSIVHKAGNAMPETYYEIVGTGTTKVEKLEIHFTDNTSDSEYGSWIVGFGWSSDNGGSLIAPDAYCADIFGGSRPYISGTNKTSGGLRYCTYSAELGSFKYCVGIGTPNSNFTNVTSGATANVFKGSSFISNTIPNSSDNTYLTFGINETNIGFDQQFTVSYDDTNSYITDLAGNRLRSFNAAGSMDRAQPKISLVISAVGSDELYIEFVKKLTNQVIYKSGPDASDIINLPFDETITKCFKVGKISGDTFVVNTGTQLQIDSTQKAQIIDSHSNTEFTAVKLKFNRPVTLEDIETCFIRLESDGVHNPMSYDPFTNISNSYVSFVQDQLGNYMQMYSAHSISDFAVNSVNPSYAYNPSFTDENGNLIQQNLYSNDSQAVHDWGPSQGNYGTLKVGEEIILGVDVTDGADGTNNPQNLVMYLSENPTLYSDSVQINSDLNKNYRVWIPNSSFNPISPVFNAAVTTLPGNFDSTEGLFFFDIEETVYSNWHPNDQITFLFGILDASGNPVKIIHEPVLAAANGSRYNLSATAYVPLYALRLDNQNDITSFDLWSFKVKSATLQRGGITVMNNVINPNDGEKAIVNLNMSSSGSVSIMIMTLDGSIVTYLNRGEVSAGEHNFTWDGRNGKGKIVARGIYFVRVVGNGIDETRKIMIVK